MPARNKLNAAAVHGAMLIAGLIALLLESWTVFCVIAAILVATALHSGDIRLRPPR